MDIKSNTVRGFVAHCVRLINNGEYREDGEFFEPQHGIKTELIIPYGLFVVNTPQQAENTAILLQDTACIEFPAEQNWSVVILSSDEKTYLETVKILNLET